MKSEYRQSDDFLCYTKSMEKGVFCLSIDTELLWGRNENLAFFIQAAKKVRPVVKKLLLLFEKYDFPATWAIVGELFRQGDPLWHAPDIIKMIKKTKNQEIACHSFSHLVFDKHHSSPQLAKNEIKNCLKIAKQNNIEFHSFVFPFNKSDYLDVLKKNGFTSFRGAEPRWFKKIPKLDKILQIIDFFLLIPPPVSLPMKQPSGLINIPGSIYYVSQRGLRHFIPLKFRIIKAKKGLNAAVKKKAVFHLWFHAIDLTQETDKMIAGLEAIIKYASQLQNKGQIEMKSMKQIAESFKD